MKTVSVELYEFDELSDTAKEKAREWYRDGSVDISEYVFADAQRVGEILGIEITTRSRKRVEAEKLFCEALEKLEKLSTKR